MQVRCECFYLSTFIPLLPWSLMSYRYKFPMELKEETEVILGDDGEIEDIVFARNDPLVNKYNEWVLQTWRANMDFTAISNSDVVARLVSVL